MISSTIDSSKPRRHETVYHPVISSMVQQPNIMKNCTQVLDMHSRCEALRRSTQYESEETFVCRTAQRYHDLCLQGHEF
jgi:hypothetical protein